MDFTASIALEVRTSSAAGPFIRFNFKNGTNDVSYNTYGIMGSASGDVPIQTFIHNLSPLGIENLPEWCTQCGNNYSRGCQFLQQGNANAIVGLGWGGEVSPVGAGFLGAGLTVVVVGILMAIAVVSGIVRVGKKTPIARISSNSSSRGSESLVVRTCPELH